MKRIVQAALLALALAGLGQFAQGGEELTPGLEIFDSGQGAAPGPAVQYPADSQTYQPYQPLSDPYAAGEVYTGQPGPVYSAPDPYAAPDSGVYSDPFAAPEQYGEAQLYADPQAPVVSEPLGAAGASGAAGVEVSPLFPADPAAAALGSLNTSNPHFRGLAEAQAQGNLAMAADVVWQVLKQRRVIDATMARGPGASAGMPSSYDLERVLEAVNYMPAAPYQGNEDQLAAYRIHTIIDSFTLPIVDDYTYGGNMTQLLIRLFSDIYAVRYAMSMEKNDQQLQELAGAYLRAVVNCDFFIYPRRELTTAVNGIMANSQHLFLPDGASIAGDTGGITGQLFHNMLTLYHYSRDDSWFKRDIGSVWKTLEQPSRYLVDVAGPNGMLPAYGPRGRHELSPAEIAQLNELFPKPRMRTQRIGLAASASFPSVSNQQSYGGIFAMRSNAGTDPRYLSVRFGPYGQMTGVPGHQDFGSLTLSSHNIRYIIDPGGVDGRAAEPGVHNLLSLDENYVAASTYTECGQPVDSIWRTNASLDYVTDAAGFVDGKTWQRTVAYVKNLPGENRYDYWLVLDHVDMKNDPTPRRARIRYQLAPGIQTYNDGAGILATANYGNGPGLRIFAVDGTSELLTSEGDFGVNASHIYNTVGGAYAAPAIDLVRTLVGDTTTVTMLYPANTADQRPVRIERDSDIIRGRTGALVIDHGLGRLDVIAWTPPGQELVTPTLNLQLSADLAVFRLRKGKLVRMDFVNLERFQAKEPDGGNWSMRVDGPAQTLTLEPEKGGGWQILSDPSNRPATLYDINLGPAIYGRRVGIRANDLKIVPR